MKRVLLLGFLVLLVIPTYGQKRIKKVEVHESGFGISLRYNPIVDEITYDGMKVKITPISPESIGLEFPKEQSYNGKFNYSYYDRSRTSYFLNKKMRKRVKSDIEFILDGIEWLLDEEKISQKEYSDIENQINDYFDESGHNENPSSSAFGFYNPYAIDDKYLSTFKIEIDNPTNLLKKFDNDIIFSYGDQTQEPLTNEELNNLLDNDNSLNPRAIESISRHNLRLPWFIPPKLTVQKYMAIFPVDLKNNRLYTFIEGSEAKFEWVIEKTETQISQTYNFFEVQLEYSLEDYSSDEPIVFNVIDNSRSTINVDDNKIYIDEHHLSDKFEMFSLGLSANKLFFARKEFTGSELVDLGKSKRYVLTIELEKIDEVKKKIKL